MSSRSPSDSSPAVSPHLSSSPRARTARSCSSQLLDVGWTSDRHVSGTRSLAASPRPSMSADADAVFDLPSTSSNQECDQALDISRLNLRDEEQAMCLAIALSIQDTSSSSAGCSISASTSNTVDSSVCQHSSDHGGFAQPTETLSSVCGSSSNTSHKLLSHGAAHCTGSRHEFEFPRSLVVGETNMENVFEPRPPHPVSSPQLGRAGQRCALVHDDTVTVSPQPGHSGQRCALAHDETVTVLDPWRRRPSSLDHGRPHKSSHCTRPSETHGASSGKKSKSSSRRRRSCGSHLPHRTPPDIGYMSDRTISPVPGSVDRLAGSAGSRPAVSRDRQPPADSLNLVISSDILESMLQGAEGYCAAAETAAPVDAPTVSTDDGTTQQVASKDDCDSVFL